MWSSRGWTAVMAGLVALCAACAHAGAAGDATAGTAPRAAASRPGDGPVLVTGSRIPQRVKLGCNSLSNGIDNVRVYCKQQLDSTGRDGNLAAALRDLDPSF